MKPRVGAEIDCFDQALHFVDAQRLRLAVLPGHGEACAPEDTEALGVRQAFQRLRVGGLEKPIVASGSNDLATHVNRRPHAVSAEKTKEVCISAMPIIESHNQRAGRKIAPLLAPERFE
jgi:hypothetical protein